MNLQTMAQNDFLQTLLDMMDKRMDGLSSQITANTQLTQKALDEVHLTNGTVQDHTVDIQAIKDSIAKVETKSGSKLDLPPNLIYLIAFGAVILLLIIATLLHVNIGGIGG